ncbi:hypothetical protein [Methylobacterium sp. J-070]|uniref:hypothetical protein n=1 Tax=Methylobacterium sp. J-070 TaxID=2836650 RepID=UPI001FB93D4E|nr:hypothetical protein [Methylobacterium sp. J-070]MCJ2048526.1 hypothetical protein [Methylobacterium sp. J-070]
MTEPRLNDQDPFGTLDTARENVAQLAASIQAHAHVVQTYAEVGYDPGLMLAARTTLAYLRALEAGLQELERSRAVISYRQSGATIGSGAGV